MSIRSFFKPAAGAVLSPGSPAAVVGARLAEAANVSEAPTPKRFKSGEPSKDEEGDSPSLEKHAQDGNSTLTAEQQERISLNKTAAEVPHARTLLFFRIVTAPH
jgi:hypothetical protein